MARDALDDKDLKSDPLQDFVFQAIDYVHKRQRRFIAGAVAVVVVVVSGSGWFLYSQTRKREMAAAFDAAWTLYLDREGEGSERIEEARKAFTAFVDEHGEASLTPYAWIYLGALALEAGQPEEAERAFRAAAEHPAANESVRVIAATAQAKISENKGDFEPAGERYRALPAERWGDLAAFSLGRIAVSQDNLEEARAQLERLQQEFPESPLAPTAREALSYYP